MPTSQGAPWTGNADVLRWNTSIRIIAVRSPRLLRTAAAKNATTRLSRRPWIRRSHEAIKWTKVVSEVRVRGKCTIRSWPIAIRLLLSPGILSQSDAQISRDAGKGQTHAVFDARHVPPHAQMIKEILHWLDRYQGPLR